MHRLVMKGVNGSRDLTGIGPGSNATSGISVTAGAGGTHVSASRSRCCRIACAEAAFTVTVFSEVRRKVRVARLTVKLQIASNTTAIRPPSKRRIPAKCPDRVLGP